MLPAVAFKLNALPTVFPELLALRVIVLAAVSVIFTAPVDVAVNVVAFSGFAANAVIPAVPAFKLTVAELSAPPVVMPLAA
jgi:hypothetical protein